MFLNYSRVSLFKQCRRKWGLTYFIGGGRKPERENEHFLIGRAVHKGLEWLALHVTLAATKAMEYYLESRSKHWKGVALEEWTESADLVMRMVGEYKDKAWNKHDFIIVNTEKLIARQADRHSHRKGGHHESRSFVQGGHQRCGSPWLAWVGPDSINSMLDSRRRVSLQVSLVTVQCASR